MLPWVFEAHDRVGCEFVLVPRPGEVVDDVPDGVVDVLRCDVLGDPADALRALRSYRDEHRLDGVFTMDDPAVPITAVIAAELGLPGISPEAAVNATDKRGVHRLLRAAGAHTPASVAVPVAAQPPPLGDLRFPVVVKPASAYGSMGVVRVDDPADLAEELLRVEEVARRDLPPESAARGLLVQEYVDGPEFAVESFVRRGRTYVHSIGYKGEPRGPYFEEGVYRAPANLPPDVRSTVVEQIGLVNEALGIESGPVHSELRLRSDGTPFVFDVGARIGGSGVSHFIVRHSTGIDFIGNALRVALGREPVGLTDEPRITGYASNYIVPCGGAGVIREIAGLDEVAELDCVELTPRFLFPGDLVRPYPEFSGRPAFVMSVHGSEAEMIAFDDHLDEKISIHYHD
ncbi:ATP-grasp domain-containing protein [Saccharothrix sp. Mg75]|uniref:ATP-grasp domain-containing protein n=1 Tax=Saccharothrix sp. Mg75 TaxID=3445357 RepID=UPI003EE987A3